MVKAKEPPRDVDASILLARPAISPDELLDAQVIPLGRNSLYAALNSGEIESFRIGKLIMIPTAPLRRKLGIEAA